MRTQATLLALAMASSALAAPPTVFAPDVISGPAADSAPAFAPDGKIVYFTRSNPQSSVIVVSHLRGTTWTTPTIAPFSGEWSDMEPAMAPDGSFLVFVSNRPTRTGGAVLDGKWNGKSYPAAGGNLWRVDRKGDGWGPPVRLPEAVNTSDSTFAPAVAGDGSLYFMHPDGDGNHFHIYRSQLSGGTYQHAVPVAFGEPSASDVDPAVARDESYAVFGSSRAGGREMDIYLVRKKTDGTWGTPRNLVELNAPGSDAEARLSPDGQTLYFSSERTVNVTLPRTRAQAEQDLARQSWDNSLYNIWQADLRPYLR